MSDVDLAERYLEALSTRDFEAASGLLADDAEVVTPDGAMPAKAFLEEMRSWPGLDHLELSIEDRQLSEEDGAIVSTARRVFRWRESGEFAYDQPAESRVTVRDGKIVRAEIVR
jgi:ketosteroid isomerase-like protein